MSILHRRRQVKERWKQREASGERCSAPHEYVRASHRHIDNPPPAADTKPKPRAKRKAKPKAKRA